MHQMKHLTQPFISYRGDLIMLLMFKKKSMGITMVNIKKNTTDNTFSGFDGRPKD